MQPIHSRTKFAYPLPFGGVIPPKIRLSLHVERVKSVNSFTGSFERSRRLWLVNEGEGFEVLFTSVHVFRAVVVHRAADGDGAARAAFST